MPPTTSCIFPQGYWAVFTVIIVLQGSIASTFGAAIDRLAGTIAGALVGGIATLAIQRGELTTGVALTLVLGVTAFVAAVRPQLKVAPVTAAIMLLTQPAGAHVATYVVDRVLEIALGGFIGVATSVLVFPARSEPLVIALAASALEHMRYILGLLADGLERGEPLSLSDDHVRLRAALGSVEQAAADAARERASRLASGSTIPVIARALWRVRNDLILVARAIDTALPHAAAEVVAAPAAAFIRAEAAYTGRCAAALRAGTAVPSGKEQATYQTFEAAFSSLRSTGVIRQLDFADAGRVFGLAFAIEVLRRDLADFGDRLGSGSSGEAA